MMYPRLIAFYLPQYHPIPENDAWWGKGFTEWTNVAKAKPLFKGHYQPHLPADLGFYDLRVPEVREQQAELAREAGIEGFCYWHYWFAGKQLLERPFNEVLASGKPDFPFCLAWANESWTGVWHGASDKILIEQTYPGEQDHIDHFYNLLPAFRDPRYIRVDGKPLLFIYRPGKLPHLAETLALWQKLAAAEGLPGLFLTGFAASESAAKQYCQAGINAITIMPSGWQFNPENKLPLRVLKALFGTEKSISICQAVTRRPFHTFDYSKVSASALLHSKPDFEYFPGVTSNWDNTPRAGINGYVALNSSPERFSELLLRALDYVKDYPAGHQIIMIKSWNEWAEGNYVEPDVKFGRGYLDAIKKAINLAMAGEKAR